MDELIFERVLLHLRKSRADLEAEARGEGETLEKHRKHLFNFAKNNRINIIKERMELESGESLLHRPKMQETLREVEAGIYDGVLVMDIDRLGRGDMIDQGIILRTFKDSKTKIITPGKIYDLNNEYDEDMTEYRAFFARKELKMINTRLQGGRTRSITDNKNYLGTVPPFGYLIENPCKGNRYLVPYPEQAQVVKSIFDWYTHPDPEIRMGADKIANELNRLQIKTATGRTWKGCLVLNILKNAVYAGRIQWKKKETKKSTALDKKREVKTRPQEEWIDVQGRHEPLISMEQYLEVQKILKRKYHAPYQLVNGLTNPLAGLIKCHYCGASMVYRPYKYQKYPHIMCYNRGCQNKSARFEYVQDKLVEGLKLILQSYKIDLNNRDESSNENHGVELRKSAIEKMKKELVELTAQKDNLHDLLERGIYDENTFLERSSKIADKLTNLRDALKKAETDLANFENNKVDHQKVIPLIKNVLDLYYKTDDAAKKNQLLKSVLNYAVYKKEKNQRDDDFTLVLYPIFPLINHSHTNH